MLLNDFSEGGTGALQHNRLQLERLNSINSTLRIDENWSTERIEFF